MAILLVYIACYIIFPIYGVAAHPGLALGFAAGFGASGLFVLVPVVIVAIGLPVGIALFEHYRYSHRPFTQPGAETEPLIRVNTPSEDAPSEAANHSDPIRIPNADFADNTRLLTARDAAGGGVSPTTALPSDPFSNVSDVSSITSSYTASEVNPERRNIKDAKTTSDDILSSSKPPMEDLLRGTDSRCEEAKSPIESRIVLASRPPANRSFSDDISFTAFISQMVSTFAGSTKGPPRSSTKSSESSESSESAESSRSESTNAQESPEGSKIFQPKTSIKSFSEDEMIRNRAVGLKQANEVRWPIIEAISSLSAEPDPIKPEITRVIENIVRQGLDGGSAQAASTQVAA